MDITLQRTYHSNGTNSNVLVDGQLTCKAIELPWKENKPRESCIPEGRYKVSKRTSNKYKQHLHVDKVPGRSLILIHPANDAMKELAGCIAPVTRLLGPGRGSHSRLAFEIIRDAAYAALDNGEDVWILIGS